MKNDHIWGGMCQRLGLLRPRDLRCLDGSAYEWVTSVGDELDEDLDPASGGRRGETRRDEAIWACSKDQRGEAAVQWLLTRRTREASRVTTT